MGNVRFLSLRCWMDEDGVHIWQRHDCKDGVSECILPKGTWRRNGDKVEPSIMCSDCGLHAFGTIMSAPDAD